jgi:hypothetical protein
MLRLTGSQSEGGPHLKQVGGVMASNSDEFRRYAGEALSWAEESKTEVEKKVLIDMATTYAQAAMIYDRQTARPPLKRPRSGTVRGALRMLRAFLERPSFLKGDLSRQRPLRG